MGCSAVRLRANLWTLYLIKLLRWFMVVAPIFVLFFQDRGLSMAQIMVLQSVFSIAIACCDIPTGYFADVIGRKASIIVGCVLGGVGFAVYSVAQGFVGFLIAELTIGVGSSFISGADSAMVYDTLVQLQQPDAFQRIEGRRVALGNISEGVASVLGGFLAASLSLRAPFYVETAVMWLAVPLACALVEPERRAFRSRTGSVQGMLGIIRYALHGHRALKWLILYAAVVTASTLNVVWFFQPYLQRAAFPLALFGVVWAAFKVFIGIFALCANRFERMLGRRVAFLSVLAVSVLSYALLAVPQYRWGVVGILLVSFVRGISEPVFKNAIQEEIASDIRATVDSIRNLLGRAIFSCVGPVIGWLNDAYSLERALVGAGAAFLFLGVFSWCFLHRSEALESASCRHPGEGLMSP